MKTTTVVLIVLAFITSLAIAYFQYYFKAKSIRKVTIYLFILRSLSLFLLLLLFINPTIKSKRYTVQKPVLSIVLDNSESVAYFKQDSLVQSLINDLRTNSALNKKVYHQLLHLWNRYSVQCKCRFYRKANRYSPGITPYQRTK